MNKILILLLLSLSFFSCKKQEVKVPLVARNGEEEVANNSALWFFNKNGKLDLNEHNRISSTNWFFNIDKRLPLKEVFPEVIRLFNKHNEKSPHNTKPMKNYFTYVNTLNNHLSFYNFDSIRYVLAKPNEIKTVSSDTLFLKINNSDVFLPLNPDNKNTIQPIFKGNMSFQDYLSAKAKMEKLLIKDKISKKEYIVTD